MADKSSDPEFTLVFAPFTEKGEKGDLSFRVCVKAECSQSLPELRATEAVHKLYEFCTHAAEAISDMHRQGVITKRQAEQTWPSFYKTLEFGGPGTVGSLLADVLFDGSDEHATHLKSLRTTKLVADPQDATRKAHSFGPVQCSTAPESVSQDESREQSHTQSPDLAEDTAWMFLVHSTDPTTFNASAEKAPVSHDMEPDDVSWDSDCGMSDQIADAPNAVEVPKQSCTSGSCSLSDARDDSLAALVKKHLAETVENVKSCVVGRSLWRGRDRSWTRGLTCQLHVVRVCPWNHFRLVLTYGPYAFCPSTYSSCRRIRMGSRGWTG